MVINIIKDLKNFLEKKGILDKFKKEVGAQDLYQEGTYITSLSGPIIWDDTEDKSGYWFNLHYEFLSETNQGADSLINFAEVSRTLSGTRSVITKDYTPDKHKEAVMELRDFSLRWRLKWQK